MTKKFDEILQKLNKEQFIEYYSDHNIKDTAKQFNISVDRVTQISKEIGFKKDIQKITNQIKKTKEKNFGSLDKLNKHNSEKRKQTLIEKYGDEEEAEKSRQEKFKQTLSNKEYTFKYKIKSIDKNEFIDLYINQNKSRKYLQDRYDLSSYMIDRVIDYFNCSKPNKRSSSLALDTKYSKFGSKDKYDKHIRDKQLETYIKKDGSIENHYKKVSEKVLAKRVKDHGSIHYYNKEKCKETCLNKYGVSYPCQLKQVKAASSNDSKPNKSFARLLESNNLNFEREFSIDNKSYDFKIDNVLIEINPSSTHNSTWNPFKKGPGLDSNYHQKKSILAEQNSYRCMHLWDWDDREKIINSLKPKISICARKCDLREISKYQLDVFLNNYHFQNTCKGQDIRLGLFYNNELVQVMSFGKPRFNKNYQYELLRLCTKAGYKVIGGAEKLFKHFLVSYKPNSIISYCDRSKFNGDVYSRLGFTLINKGVPTKHWYNLKTKKHILDSSLRAKGFDILLGKEYGCFGKGVSNEELMLEHNFVEIYDCGQSSYSYFKN